MLNKLIVEGSATLFPVMFSKNAYAPGLFGIFYVWNDCLSCLTYQKIKIDNKLMEMEGK